MLDNRYLLLTLLACSFEVLSEINIKNRKRIMKQAKSTRDIFAQYYLTNFWGNSESRSGDGSTVDITRVVRTELPKIIEKYEISSILDLPCGDFNWMKFVDLKECNYIGADIVKELIQKNNDLYAKPLRKFITINAVEDTIPMVDLIFCRDMFVHLSEKDIRKTLRNFKASGSKYLLTTTYTKNGTECIKTNRSIKSGSWRPTDLEKPPYNFPKPLLIFDEKSSRKFGLGKSLALWELKDIPV